MNPRKYRQKCLGQKINVCNACGTSDGKLVVHHLDGDPTNNVLDNLIPMCKSCHSKIHNSKGLTGYMKELQDRLPESALSYGEGDGAHKQEGGSTSRIPVSSETRDIMRERKPRGMTYDLFLRQLMGVEDPAGRGR